MLKQASERGGGEKRREVALGIGAIHLLNEQILDGVTGRRHRRCKRCWNRHRSAIRGILNKRW